MSESVEKPGTAGPPLYGSAHEAKAGEGDVYVSVAKSDMERIQSSQILKESLLGPQDQMQIVYRDLNFSVKIKKKESFFKSTVVEKAILKGVTGVLAGEARQGVLTGSIQVNGEEVKSNIKKISGFVFQDDVILATMTVREAISMSALLRLPREMSTEEKEAQAAGTIIGDSTNKGISGGERKRTAMAMEMITNPSVLFLDEPTSGLDTFTAYSVVNTLKNLACTGRTVVATIHQPSSEVFHLFDDLLLMAEGRIIYAGAADKAVDYFAKYGYVCPDFTNPADCAKGGISTASMKVSSGYDLQFRYLFQRASKNALRNPLIIKAKAGQTIVMALIIGILYLGTGADKSASGSQNRDGLLFFATVNNVMSSTISVLSIFGEEKNVFAREFGAGYYGLPPYFISKVMVEFPFNIVFPYIFATIVYWMVGLQARPEKYFLFCVFCILSSCSGFSLGIAIACVFEDLETALSSAPLILMPLMLFSGLFVNNGAIPVYFDWIKYISPMHYAYEGLVKNEYTGLSITCAASFPEVETDGSVCISLNGMDDQFTIGLCVLLLAVMMISLIIVAYLSLLRIVLTKGKPVEPSPAKAEA
ncbi:ATP-binding cassette sub- G member 1 [Blyttiomyces sp. JEL0837]|nr:ATP-binding cassette sub- G member 1 [Blyttiomyces sp. JEL0837]